MISTLILSSPSLSFPFIPFHSLSFPYLPFPPFPSLPLNALCGPRIQPALSPCVVRNFSHCRLQLQPRLLAPSVDRSGERVLQLPAKQLCEHYPEGVHFTGLGIVHQAVVVVRAYVAVRACTRHHEMEKKNINYIACVSRIHRLFPA